MRRKKFGQSITEMALILPLLLVILFGIVDMGYYIYGFATIYQSARNGAEVAAGAPPYPGRLQAVYNGLTNNDQCMDQIHAAVQNEATLFPDLTDPEDPNERYVTISYPQYQKDPRDDSYITGDDVREIGYPVEVKIEYEFEPLTPLWRLIPLLPGVAGDDGSDRIFKVSTTARRSITSFARDPSDPDRSVCEDYNP